VGQTSGATKSGVVKHEVLLQANFGHLDSDDNLAFRPFVGKIPSIAVFTWVASRFVHGIVVRESRRLVLCGFFVHEIRD